MTTRARHTTPAAQAARHARDVARFDSGRTYEGQPCSTCQGTVRYTVSAACVQCVRQAARDRHVKQVKPGDQAEEL